MVNLDRLRAIWLTRDCAIHAGVAAALMALPPHSWAQALAVSLLFLAREAEQAHYKGHGTRWTPWAWPWTQHAEWAWPAAVSGIAALLLG